MKRRPSKILPNNSAIAVAARDGEVLDTHVEPPQSLLGFRPWNREQPAYVKWLREMLQDSTCQCSDTTCHRPGEQMHHEKRGADKDDRTIVWLSRHCHHDIRHHHGCPPEFVLGCRAAAGENWLSYGDALEPRGGGDLAQQMEAAQVGSEETF